jgi:hypothetical protein
VRAGCCNLAKHIANARSWGIPVVVAINRFVTDTEGELEAVRQAALEAGADDAAVAQHHGLGGEGAVDLARAVMGACEKPAAFKFTYPLDISLKVADSLWLKGCGCVAVAVAVCLCMWLCLCVWRWRIGLLLLLLHPDVEGVAGLATARLLVAQAPATRSPASGYAEGRLASTACAGCKVIHVRA